ncbi:MULTISPECIES: hypothetical protein [Streptomyces]|jgi:hypothetical protein|uniref:Uncharacterized protein n=1 Tax=Streptomyces doudnae TaxID=3075536 RepID=A0ABD5EYI1_9ACTN|nr:MULTISPECIES: hypothetical protein [unclassified Streptomyces]MDT0439826.1 hypothetical protein [Streptomyces sp. DSM 41981]MYQ66883.1 hypothetical protein [Streptomyces sp. SID4950]SCE26822.1 hypothetical protein GA0115242_127524 [Streptomyces sp. SolWspMP-5a-2]
MRMRTTIAAGLLAVTAVLGSAGSALAHDRGDDHSSGGFAACGMVAGAGNGHGFYGNGCAGAHWKGNAPTLGRFPF